MSAFTSTALQYSSTSYLQSWAPYLEGTRDHNSRCVRVRSYKPTSQILHQQNVARGLTIQNTATKPAKSPGMFWVTLTWLNCHSNSKMWWNLNFIFCLEIIAEEEWKVKRELLLKKRVKLRLYVIHALLNARISTLASLAFTLKWAQRNFKIIQKLEISGEVDNISLHTKK